MVTPGANAPAEEGPFYADGPPSPSQRNNRLSTRGALLNNTSAEITSPEMPGYCVQHSDPNTCRAGVEHKVTENNGFTSFLSNTSNQNCADVVIAHGL